MGFVNDHALEQLDRIMEGRLDGLFEALITYYQKQQLSVNNDA